MANLYDKYLLPKITNLLCSSSPNMKQRQKVVPLAYGKVLEVGAGTGLNFAFYDPEKVGQLYALEPSESMWSIARKKLAYKDLKVEFLKGVAEHIPMKDQSVDTIVITYTLCTIPDVPASLTEMKRVLRPDGKLIFCEHGLAPDESVQRWQRRLISPR